MSPTSENKSEQERLDRGQVDAEAALLRALVDKLPAMLAYWDADQRCRFANRAYEKWFGVKPETMIGRGMRDFLGPLYELNRPYIEGVLRGQEQEFERDIPDPAGGPARHSQAHYIPDIVDGKVRGFCVLVADITRRTQAEEALHHIERQLQATERLAAMATLAAGIAHEINNPLAAAQANIELTLESLKSGQPDLASINTMLAEARDGTKRIRDIVQSMKLLARGDTSSRELINVNETLEQSIGLASNVIRYRARLVRKLGQAIYIVGNPAQLAQVLVNLLINAAQALPDENAEQNEIRISTRHEADQVVIEVADNGCGIPDELQARIFEPFFTTRDVGVGMGLGLPISSGIVNGLGGTISVTSRVGEGSVFRVVLPAAAQLTIPPESTTRLTNGRAASPAGPLSVRPRVLVIDDDPAVTRTLQRILKSDCDVVAVNHGRDACAMLMDDRQAPFVLILCDLMMPEVSGDEVYNEVVKKRPELAGSFVFMTGGAFTARGRQFLDTVQLPVLDKPFDVARLRAVVSERIGRGAGRWARRDGAGSG